MSNSMVQVSDLTDFPGAPFSQKIVDSAVRELRSRLGWHVAPVITETLTLDHDGGPDLVLPTRRIVSVTEIRDVSGTTPAVVTGYRTSRNTGIVTRGYWPCGLSVLEVDLTHGYEIDPLPEDLLAAVASMASYFKSDTRARSVQIDDFQTEWFASAAMGSDSQVMTTYGLPRDF